MGADYLACRRRAMALGAVERALQCLGRCHDFMLTSVNARRWADVVPGREITLGRRRHSQAIERDDLAPRQAIGEAAAHWHTPRFPFVKKAAFILDLFWTQAAVTCAKPL